MKVFSTSTCPHSNIVYIDIKIGEHTLFQNGQKARDPYVRPRLGIESSPPWWWWAGGRQGSGGQLGTRQPSALAAAVIQTTRCLASSSSAGIVSVGNCCLMRGPSLCISPVSLFSVVYYSQNDVSFLKKVSHLYSFLHNIDHLPQVKKVTILSTFKTEG